MTLPQPLVETLGQPGSCYQVGGWIGSVNYHPLKRDGLSLTSSGDAVDRVLCHLSRDHRPVDGGPYSDIHRRVQVSRRSVSAT